MGVASGDCTPTETDTMYFFFFLQDTKPSPRSLLLLVAVGAMIASNIYVLLHSAYKDHQSFNAHWTAPVDCRHHVTQASRAAFQVPKRRESDTRSMRREKRKKWRREYLKLFSVKLPAQQWTKKRLVSEKEGAKTMRHLFVGRCYLESDISSGLSSRDAQATRLVFFIPPLKAK